MNGDSLDNFRWDLWFFATTCPFKENISISNEGECKWLDGNDAISYCEITMTGEGPLNPDRIQHSEFLSRSEDGRVDIWANRQEGRRAFHQVETLCKSKDQAQEITIFDHLIIRLVEDEMIRTQNY